MFKIQLIRKFWQCCPTFWTVLR